MHKITYRISRHKELSSTNNSISKPFNGFTIVELLIVIVVIGILAAISIVSYTGIQNRARDTQRNSDIIQIKKALLAYNATNGGVVRTWGVTGYTKPTSEPTYGNWDVSTSANWLSFLREDNGNMPVDPDNTNPVITGTNPLTGANRMYIYYCYEPGGLSGYPDTSAVALMWKNQAGVALSEKFAVDSCLTTLP